MNDEYDGPGIYDMSEDSYRSDPVPGGSLSASGCKTILRSPAKFQHNVLEGNEVFKDAFDFGKAAHSLVLGVGAEIDVIDAPDWRKKDAGIARDESRAAGRVPLLKKDHATVLAMADQLHQHPLAGLLLDPENGKAEQSLFWKADGITKRARLDWLPEPVDGKRLIVPDYKTTGDDGANTFEFSKSVVNYGYDQQAAFYLEGVMTLLDVKDPAFVFIVQEKVAPYLVNVIELSPELLLRGEQRNQRAINVYRECMKHDEWPAYGDGVNLATSPTWASYQHQENLELWAMAS